MIEVHLKGGKIVIVDADEVKYQSVRKTIGMVSMLTLLKGSEKVGEFDESEVTGWNQATATG